MDKQGLNEPPLLGSSVDCQIKEDVVADVGHDSFLVVLD